MKDTRYEHAHLTGKVATRRPPTIAVRRTTPSSVDAERRLWLALRTMLALVLLIIPAATAHSQEPQATLAVGDNAIFLTGFRPPTNQGGIDLSGYIEVPYSAALNPAGGQITIEAWVKRNETARNETIVGNGWTSAYWFGFSDSGKLRFTPHGDTGLVDSNATVPAGVWTHVAVTYDGVNRRYYINGVLDTATTAKPGALVGASSGQPLGIGHDRDDFNPNYFGGGIDNVRIWNTVRNGADIQATMFQSFGVTLPNLLAEWSFDGNLQDTAGGHDGVAKNNVQFSNDGAIPHDMRIAQVDGTPTLDGACGSEEYANATQVTVDGTGVRLLHTADALWVCFDGLGGDNQSASVYLDPDYTRLDPAQVEHLSLTVDESNAKTARAGKGDNTYTDTTAADGLWDAAYTNCCGEFPTRRAEFRIAADLLNGWSHVIGMALAKSTGVRGGTDLWPALALSYLPSTWSSAILSGVGPQRSFSGQVVYQPPDSSAPATGVAGVVVKLIGRDSGGSEAMTAMAESSPSGNFSLTSNDDFAEHRLELGPPPKGYRVETATADAPGVVIDSRTIDYAAAGGGSYPNNVFTLGDITPGIFDVTLGPYFLIVAPQAVIDDGALDEFVDFKRRIGFTVAVESVEQIDATTAGANRRGRIRNFEKSIRNAVGLRFQYVMLIGTNNEIPYPYFTEGFTGYTTEDGSDDPVKDLTACLADHLASDSLNAKNVKVKRTEWYYADLVSNFDSNGNGCLLDGTRSKAEERAPGYTPDTRPTFNANVAVGRLPFANPTAVRTALQNSMRFEQQSEAFKQRMVFAMSQVFLKGQYWTPKDDTSGTYKPCPLDPADSKDTTVDKNCQSKTTDAAYLGERMRNDFLNALGYQSTIFYESAKPEGASPVQSPQPLTIKNLKAEMSARAQGFVDLAGHGGTGGVARTFWASANQNGKVDSPTAPLPFNSVDEASGAELFYRNSFGALTPRNGRAAIFMAAACSTLAPTSVNNIGAYALSQGYGIAWFGALNMINAGPWTQPTGGTSLTVNYFIAQQLFGNHMRLGDALWLTSQQIGATNASGSADVSFALYGDPTLSYWGNPGGQTTLAAWPMLRYDARGIGFTTLAGPEVPKKLWQYDANSSSSAPRSPVLSNNGEVIVAHGSVVDVLRQGQLHQRLNLDGDAFGTPAIAADGTIYALDTSGRLYAFPYQSYLLHPLLNQIAIGPAQDDVNGAAVAALGQRYRHWRVELGGAARTSPVIGADGMIALGIGSKVMLVRPDGLKLKDRSVPGQPILALAADAERNVYVATTGGYAARINFFSPNCPGDCTWHQQGAAYSTPPLLAYGAVYIGRANGEVVKLDKSNMQVVQTFAADSAITAGPIAGPAGQVLVGTQNGTLYSLTKDVGLRWQRNLGTPIVGVPAFSSDALYVVAANSLRAFNPFSGAPMWSRNLGSVGAGSVAVGYGRELDIQTVSGAILAYGEGWTNPVIAVSAHAVAVENRPLGIKVMWYTQVPPIGGGVAQAASTDANSDLLIQRRSGAGPWSDLTILPAGTTVYTDTTTQPGESYAYRVQVLGDGGNSSDFVETLVEVQSALPTPQSPTWESLTAVGADALALDWRSPDGDPVTVYRIERGESEGGPFAPVALTTGDATAWIDKGLDPGKSYSYRIFALNSTGESAPSAVQSATTRTNNLPAPEDVLATELEDGRIRVTWAGAPSDAQVEIQFSQGFLDGYVPLATVDAANAAYSLFPAENDVYIFRVKFIKGDAESPWTESSTVTISSQGNPMLIFMPVIFRN